MSNKAVIIAGTTSGVGKTTIATGLMGTLARQGLKVQPFKSGPDYIDPGYHTIVTGEHSRNLDTWMLGKESVLELYRRAMQGKDIAVVEGVMGLYDGRYATADEGSTSELAKLLEAPVILVVDSGKAARSIAAIVKGYHDFDPDLKLAGVILNGIGSTGHLEICRDAIEHYTGVPVVGFLPRRDDLVLPERHLGLIPTAEDPIQQEFLDTLITQCSETLDIPQIIELAETAGSSEPVRRLYPESPVKPFIRLGVARDRAFSFYYQDSLDLLEAWGAEIVPFSPMNDISLPEGISGLYLGGGFPELYAAELASNTGLKTEIAKAFDAGMPIYAECGGYMYLGETIEDFENKEFRMAGILPIKAQIKSPRLSLGYRTVTALEDNPLVKKGTVIRGHEFHWSTLTAGEEKANAWSIEEKNSFKEGFKINNLLASYIHIHFGSDPQLAPNFVESCRRFNDKL
ncbi:MAG: cobyrinate a,c-diamide synthase [Dehalococcoidales bacterium]|nr:cobyrinate a,c-diamide synthase [Dehalococcoidales bacterium]